MTEVYFTPPPSDIAVESQLDFHFSQNPNYPVAVHALPNGVKRTWTYKSVVPAVHRAGRLMSISCGLHLPLEPRGTHVIAVLATCDTLTYFTIIMGLLRAGFTIFPISPRFSSTVVGHVLNVVQPHYLFVTSDTKDLATIALSTLAPTSFELKIRQMPSYHELYTSSMVDMGWLLPAHNRSLDDTALIIHSSSSSSIYPKTISYTSKFMLMTSEILDFVPKNLTGAIFGCQALEFFHSVGLCFPGWLTRSGFVMAVLNPEDSASKAPADPDIIFEGFRTTQPEYSWISPRILEVWTEDYEKVDFLRTTTVITGGKPLNKVIGDSLVKRGVRINMAYGATESGPISLISNPQGMDWQYFQAPPMPELKFIEVESGVYDLIVVSSERRKLPIINTDWDGQPAYTAGDLFIKHSYKPNHFRMLGRRSDQIMLASGEMVDPLPIEESICQSSLVKSAVVFGHSRPYIGVIIESESIAREGVVEAILPLLEQINDQNKANAQIRKEMIVPTSTDKPIVFNPKGLPRRPLILQDYQVEIDAAYKEVV